MSLKSSNISGNMKLSGNVKLSTSNKRTEDNPKIDISFENGEWYVLLESVKPNAINILSDYKHIRFNLQINRPRYNDFKKITTYPATNENMWAYDVTDRIKDGQTKINITEWFNAVLPAISTPITREKGEKRKIIVSFASGNIKYPDTYRWWRPLRGALFNFWNDPLLFNDPSKALNRVATGKYYVDTHIILSANFYDIRETKNSEMVSKSDNFRVENTNRYGGSDYHSEDTEYELSERKINIYT